MDMCDPCSDQLAFWTHLARNFCAGSMLGETLREMEVELAHTDLGPVVRSILLDVNAGQSLSEAMKSHPDAFGKHVLCLVEGGERAGILDRVLLLILEYAWRCPACILARPGGPTK